MVSENVLSAVAPTLSVTSTVKPLVPFAVGVPLITPPVLSASPAGSVLPGISAHVYGLVPPVAASVVL
jgi:hypothetical protein